MPWPADLALPAALRDAGRLRLTLSCSAPLALFFVFLYDFQAKRFVVYGVWLGGLFIAEALARLRHRRETRRRHTSGLLRRSPVAHHRQLARLGRALARSAALSGRRRSAPRR